MLQKIIILVTFLFSLNSYAKVYLPNHINQNAKDNALSNYYKYWKNRYIKQAKPKTKKPQYLVDMFNFENVKNQKYDTTSEAMGYGLIIMALGRSLL